MTRRLQYRGDGATGWASYGPDTKAIATAFVRGVNAWVDRRAGTARQRTFSYAGWSPSLDGGRFPEPH